MSSASEKISRGNAGQFRVASELCLRGMHASITLGNTPHVDVLCTDKDGRKCVSIQVKTFRAGRDRCAVGKNAEVDLGPSFFWVLAGLKDTDHPDAEECFYVVPSAIMARNVFAGHRNWLSTPGKNGQKHEDNDMRTVCLKAKNCSKSFDVAQYKDRWDLIEAALT